MDNKELLAKKQLSIYIRGILCAAFLVMFVTGFVMHWTMLTKMMCLSCAACFAIFTCTAIKEKKWIEENGDPEHRKTVQPKKLN